MIGRAAADTSRGRDEWGVRLGACWCVLGMRAAVGVNRIDGIVWTYRGDSELL